MARRIKMAKYLTNEMKHKIVEKYIQGLKIPVIAEHLMVSERSIYRTVRQYKKGEEFEPKTTSRGRKPSYNENQKQIIIDSISEKSDITLHELIEKTGLEISESTMSRILKKLGYNRRKWVHIQ